MPRSSISTIAPPSDSRWLCTSTFDSGEEKTVAFSRISATRWTTWLTAWPITSTSGTPVSWIRWYCSTSEVAARSTSTSGIGRPHRRPASSPARTSRFSELRRMRVARWSSLNRLASWSGSCSPVSSSSISLSCRSTRPCDRRDRLTNIALTLFRRAACSVASRTASRCSWSNVVATSPISSRESMGIGSTSIGTGAVSVRRSRAMASGSRFSATSRALVCSRRSGPIIERAMSSEVRNAITRIAAMITPVVIACRWASDRSSRALTMTWSSRLTSTSRMACR